MEIINKQGGESRQQLVSPASTPISIVDEERSLVPYYCRRPPRRPWYKKYPPPKAILTASLLEIIIYVVADRNPWVFNMLRFDPARTNESWRFLSYMFLHENVLHLILNVVIQCLFAVALESKQGATRVAFLYLGGGVSGAVGAALLQPQPMVGASAGVYALLTSHISHIILNFDTLTYKLYRAVSVLIIIGSDITYNLVHTHNQGMPSISWGAHIAGATSGLLLGFLLYSSTDSGKTRTLVLSLLGLVYASVLVVIMVLLMFMPYKHM